MVFTIGIGFIIPQLGLYLFVGVTVSAIAIEKLSKAIVLFFFAMLMALLIAMFIP